MCKASNYDLNPNHSDHSLYQNKVVLTEYFLILLIFSLPLDMFPLC